MSPSADRDALPSALRARAEWTHLTAGVPALLVRPPAFDEGRTTPLLIWLHGRTAHKELDPGRYLRLMRSGIAICAVDLPGHGERHRAELLEPERTLDVVLRMESEIDGIVQDLRDLGGFDPDRTALGGMSAGGMAALARLCRPHTFAAATVEATTGDWDAQRERAMFRAVDPAIIDRWNPIRHLDGWREIPLQAIHTRSDEWIRFDGQERFINALRDRAVDPQQIELIAYDRTGAPHEHIGFGRMAADAKDRQRTFLRKWLHPEP